MRAFFCVLDRPYVVWCEDVARENVDFLKSIDHEFYYRLTHDLFFGQGHPSENDTDGSEHRKDYSSIARLLWNHGIETLAMLLGAYVQAPHATPAFFLKCRNDDTVQIARYLISNSCPKCHYLRDSEFSLRRIVSGIHRCAGWADHDDVVDRFTRVASTLLQDHARSDHRAEYDSIKHGLRASHGKFGVAIGVQDGPGIPAPPERMEMIASTPDGSHFVSAVALPNISKQPAKIHFKIDHQSVGWQLDRVLCELQLLSVLIGNVVSAIQIQNGTKAGEVKFQRPADVDDWWDLYLSMDHMPLHNFKFGIDLEVAEESLPTDEDVFEFYRGLDIRRP